MPTIDSVTDYPSVKLRWFVTVCFADELTAAPKLLETYARAFEPDDDATLVLYGGSQVAADSHPSRSDFLHRFSLTNKDRPATVTAADPAGTLEPLVQRQAHAVLTNGEPPRAFGGIPVFRDSNASGLRALAERAWAAPDAWLWRAEPAGPGVIDRSAPGDFYSPIANTPELATEPRRAQIWPATPRLPPGIDFREDSQIALCNGLFARQDRLTFADSPARPDQYFTANDQYPALDAWVLEAFLRHLRPKRLVEVGAGFSTLVTARVNTESLGGSLRVTCIDPYPQDFLASLSGVEVRAEQVQDSPLSLFTELEAGDVLFIDSSHVVKTGSDTTWLYLELLPRLAPGVVVHLHDMFFPRDYPQKWVMEGWGWNEQYLVRAFLLFNSAYEVLWSTQVMLLRHRDVLARAFPGVNDPRYAAGGSSFWMQRADGGRPRRPGATLRNVARRLSGAERGREKGG